MTETDPRDAGIDRLLRRTLSVPVPALPSDFEQRVSHKVRRSSQPLSRHHQIFLAGYGLLSAVTSAYIMRDQGLAWGSIAAAVITPLAVIAATRWAWRTDRPTTQP